ncbi:cytochrome P450 2A13-like [Paramormyrops kingsleyae]|uniref:cytochrome P450 2A13-like n=1 Tax=Paramormyrops kingsleyae TaxID=1676925 RepID=UPI003B972636
MLQGEIPNPLSWQVCGPGWRGGQPVVSVTDQASSCRWTCLHTAWLCWNQSSTVGNGLGWESRGLKGREICVGLWIRVSGILYPYKRVHCVCRLAHSSWRATVTSWLELSEGTAVIPLLTSVLRDESEWESPNTFNPSHFLDDQGRFKKRDAFMPFSAGRRVCLGESLARMEIFLFFTSLLLKFRFTPPPRLSESDLDLTPADVSSIQRNLCMSGCLAT